MCLSFCKYFHAPDLIWTCYLPSLLDPNSYCTNAGPPLPQFDCGSGFLACLHASGTAQLVSQLLHSLQEELWPPGMGIQSLLQKSTSAETQYPLSLLKNVTFASFLPSGAPVNASYWCTTLEVSEFGRCGSQASSPDDEGEGKAAGRRESWTTNHSPTSSRISLTDVWTPASSSASPTWPVSQSHWISGSFLRCSPAHALLSPEKTLSPQLVFTAPLGHSQHLLVKPPCPPCRAGALHHAFPSSYTHVTFYTHPLTCLSSPRG